MNTLRLLVVEDEVETLERIERVIRTHFEDRLVISGESDFDAALGRLEKERFDLIVLDVRRQADSRAALQDELTEAGQRCYQAIRAVRFLPIIFHTGLPEVVRELESSVVRIVAKGGAPDELTKALSEMISSGLPTLVQTLVAHVERVHRDYMWTFGATAWAQYRQGRAAEFAHLLARRLALSFDEAGIQGLLLGLGEVAGERQAEREEGGLNPARMYIMPPLDPSAHRMGDIYKGSDEFDGFWVLLTPSCDLVAAGTRVCKVDEVIVAKAIPLREQREYRDWISTKSKEKTNSLKDLLRNRRDRYYFLPEVFDLPDLLVDTAALRSVPVKTLGAEGGLKSIASLDTPYAAELLTKFLRQFGRFGTADLDVDYVIARLDNSTG